MKKYWRRIFVSLLGSVAAEKVLIFIARRECGAASTRREQPQAPGSAAEVRDVGLVACRASDAFWLRLLLCTGGRRSIRGCQSRADLPPPLSEVRMSVGVSGAPSVSSGTRRDGIQARNWLLRVISPFLPPPQSCACSGPHKRKILLSQKFPRVYLIYRAEIPEKSANV